jgi:hypothetical protein
MKKSEDEKDKAEQKMKELEHLLMALEDYIEKN